MAQSDIQVQEPNYQKNHILYDKFITKSLKKIPAHNSFSFEENCCEVHAITLRQHYKAYIQKIIGYDLFSNKTIQLLYEVNSDTLYQNFSNNELEQIILSNTLLNEEAKYQFIVDLEHQNFLSELLDRLTKIHSIQIMSELIYLAYQAWNSYAQLQNTLKVTNPILKSFKARHNIQDSEQDMEMQFEVKKLKLNELLSQADSFSEYFQTKIQNDANINFLTLKNREIGICQQQIQFEFNKFLRIFNRTIYLCIDEHYENPHSGNGYYSEDNSNYIQFEEII